MISDVEFTDIGIKSENLVNVRNGNNNETKSNLKRKLSYNDCIILVSDSD